MYSTLRLAPGHRQSWHRWYFGLSAEGASSLGFNCCRFVLASESTDGIPVRSLCQQLGQRGSFGFGGVCVSRGGSLGRAGVTEVFSQPKCFSFC